MDYSSPSNRLLDSTQTHLQQLENRPNRLSDPPSTLAELPTVPSGEVRPHLILPLLVWLTRPLLTATSTAMTSTASSSLSPSRTPTSAPSHLQPHSSISGPAYLSALSAFIKQHEASLANYYAPRPRNPPRQHTPPSWATVLTLGIVPTAEGGASSSSPTPPPPRRDPLVLKFDPHHLYYLLLKFDELGISGAGELDVKIDGGTSRPMSVDYSSLPLPTNGAGVGGGSILGGMFGLGAAGAPKADDARSVTSGISSFSFGSGWWGLGGGAQKEQQDEAEDVRYIYSSCTKLPALKLSPFLLTSSPSAASGKKDTTPALVRVVEGFEDCPPPSTCVPLGAFKNLSSLVLEDLDPRGFLGWDILSIQLRSLEVHRGGIEDIGELICDAPTEDEKRRMATEWRGRAVGSERRRRAEGTASTGGSEDLLAPSGKDSHSPPSPATASYPTPSKLAWSSLRHLSLSDNSLTFIPSPPLSFLPTLTSLDLSSNLLISIPPGLSHLTSLRSLNLSDNMIDSLLGVSRALGAIEVLNLSNNRLENLSGLDRLPALDRLDVRDNHLSEALEISRVARLPHLREVWVRGNPFARKKEEGGDEGWRIKVFSYFSEEDAHGHRDLAAGEIKVDGSGMNGQERRTVEAENSRRGAPARRRASTGAQGAERVAETRGGEAKVVGRRVVTAPHRAHHRASSPPPPLPSSSSTATTAADPHSSDANAAPSTSKPVTPKPKRRKPRRIVDLDAAPASTSHPIPPPSSSGQFSDSDPTSSGADLPRNATARLDRPSTVTEESTSTSTDDALSASPQVSSSTSPNAPKRQHQRYASSPSTSRLSAAGAAQSARAARVSASTYEPPIFSSSSGGEDAVEKSGEAFRRKIERLRDEVGESWLSVLGEREAMSELEAKRRVEAAGVELPLAAAPASAAIEARGSGEGEALGGAEAEGAGENGEAEEEAPQVKQGVKVVQKKKGGKGKGKKKK